MLSEAEAAVAEEGMLTPAAAAAATSADPANVAAMDFAASDTAPALGTAAAVPEAEAFAAQKLPLKRWKPPSPKRAYPLPQQQPSLFRLRVPPLPYPQVRRRCAHSVPEIVICLDQRNQSAPTSRHSKRQGSEARETGLNSCAGTPPLATTKHHRGRRRDARPTDPLPSPGH